MAADVCGRSNHGVRRWRATLPGMGRVINRYTFGPPAFCDNCYKPCNTMDQEGIVCYHCKKGVYMGRRFWVVIRCKECKGVPGALCGACDGRGMQVFPREDLNMDDLVRSWQELPWRWRQERVPEIVLNMMYLVDRYPLVTTSVMFSTCRN